MALRYFTLFAVGVVVRAILTVPMGVHQKKVGNAQPTHLRHIRDGDETYPLKSHQTLFTLNLTVNDLRYELSIDTGSADFFIKGENMTGAP